MRPIAGRGLATADFDNDGDTDIAINVRGDYPELLRNDGGNTNHWVEVFLIGTRSNRDGIGSSLKLSSEGFVQVRQAKGGTSYMSASDSRILFGLGRHTKIDYLEITWPSGHVDRLTNLPVDRITAVKEGTGVLPLRVSKGTEQVSWTRNNPMWGASAQYHSDMPTRPRIVPILVLTGLEISFALTARSVD
jgi:enediyne biosynthesis protein E4